MILVLASVCFSACCSLQLVTFCESGHFRLEMSSSLHSPIIPFDFEQPTEEWVWTLQAVKCQERWTSIVQQVSLTEISRCDVRLSLFHPQNISVYLYLEDLPLCIYWHVSWDTDCTSSLQYVWICYPQETCGPGARCPCWAANDRWRGRFGLWLDTGPKDRKRSRGLCPLHSRQKHRQRETVRKANNQDTHTHTHTHTHTISN